MTTVDLVISSFPWRTNLKDKLKEEFMDWKTKIDNIAETDLGETKVTREECLRLFREWIKKNRDIENCILDDAFLLRFLRVKKYSMFMAQQTLLKYLNLRKRFKYIFHNLDYLEPSVYEIISSGYMFPSPFRDSKGRRVILYALNNFNTNKFGSKEMSRVHAVTYETLLEDEENQILGFVHVGDGTGASMSHITMWSVNEFVTLLKWGEQSFPMRHKEFHITNMPSALKYVYDSVLNLASPKLQQRVQVHDSLEDLKEKVDPKILPSEYGGVMPMAEMIELWKKELADKRERLLSFDVMNLLSDEGIIRRRRANITPMQGSFRKLEID